MFKRASAITAISSLLLSGAYAAPLAAGKPAGLKEAQVEGSETGLILVGLAIVAGGIVLVASGNASAPLVGVAATTTTTTTTTSTTTSSGVH